MTMLAPAESLLLAFFGCLVAYALLDISRHH